MSILNFMLPTQSADAIVVDGSVLIIIAVILTAYILYKNRLNLWDTSLLPAFDTSSNDEAVHQYVFENNVNTLSHDDIQVAKNENFNYNTGEAYDEDSDEEYVKEEEKEGQKIILQ